MQLTMRTKILLTIRNTFHQSSKFSRSIKSSTIKIDNFKSRNQTAILKAHFNPPFDFYVALHPKNSILDSVSSVFKVHSSLPNFPAIAYRPPNRLSVCSSPENCSKIAREMDFTDAHSSLLLYSTFFAKIKNTILNELN